jgi:hypothetical protein
VGQGCGQSFVHGDRPAGSQRQARVTGQLDGRVDAYRHHDDLRPDRSIGPVQRHVVIARLDPLHAAAQMQFHALGLDLPGHAAPQLGIEQFG